jgi:molybdopterin-guanine dinucleotide biosynthesis adapter protein
MTQSRGQPPVIGIVGWKKSGKTTLAERLIAEFTRRGLDRKSVV